jgi:large subunit ribosomal protein L3
MSLSNRLGLLGRKVGMMRMFTDDGDAIPVTVLDVSNNRVTQVKTVENDGYSALQVAFGARKASRVTKPEAGHLAKAGVEAGEILKEFRVEATVAAEYKAGATVPVTLFAAGQKVDVQAPRSVRATPAPSSATTSARSARRTVTAVRTTCRARSRWRRIRVACSRARR